MKPYQPFQVITAGNGEPVNEALNKAVYALLENYFPPFMFKRPERMRRFTNVYDGRHDVQDIMLHDYNVNRTDILTFDARTEFGKLVEFLENPPKQDQEIKLIGAGGGLQNTALISQVGVRILGTDYTHASIIALGETVKNYIE